VRTPFGWHVIRVSEKKKAGVTPFLEAKGQIMEYLAAANQRKALEGILKKLKKSAKIEILISK
jgi:peptidyl-prolyl cis-trans isomerase C